MRSWYSLHTHSRFSAQDALPTVSGLVGKAVELGHPALGLTDHGTVAGIVQLYRHATKAGIAPLPGIEAYFTVSRHDKSRSSFHGCVVASTTTGWYNLINLANTAHRQFYYRPVIDLDNLATLSDDGLLSGLHLTTGCLSGLVAACLRSPDPTNAHNVLRALTGYFDGRVYVELMQHGITTDWHDDTLHNAALLGLAHHHSLPVVITGDAHYLNKADAASHSLMKTLVSWSSDPEDAAFNGDGYWMMSHNEIRERFAPDPFAAGIDGLHQILSGYDLKVAALDTFRLAVPEITRRNHDDDLRTRCTAELSVRGLGKRHREALEEELAVISGNGFAAYMMLVARVCDYMRSNRIVFDARGSAVGSLTCWLLGITAVDPLKYRLRFDRFLSGDRLKPPDIDIDVEHERRDEVLSWLDTTYSMAHIGTWRKLKVQDADDKGSLIVKWRSMQRKTGVSADEPIDADTMADLRRLGAFEAYDGMGVHPAGVVIVSDDATLNTLPLQRSNTGRVVTALDGKDVESMGLVKIDLLGLNTMTMIARACDHLGITPEGIPMGDQAVYRRIKSGRTTSLFQLSGGALRMGCRLIAPTNFNDLVATIALMRPATMDAGSHEVYAARKAGQQKVPDAHPLLQEVTAATYGILLYQEQVLEVMRRLGMNATDLTQLLTALKASNANTAAAAVFIESATQQVRDLATAAGFTDTDIDTLLQALAGYSNYGFNKSHAVAYARTAYLTCWLLVHHPVVWWAQVLAYCSTESLTDNIRAARYDRVRILPAHVNHSAATWTPDVRRRGVRKGLLAIDGIGPKAAVEIAAAAPFTSVADLVTRTNSRIVTGSGPWLKHRDLNKAVGVLGKLADAGALEALPEEDN